MSAEGTRLTEVELDALLQWWNTPSGHPDADGGVDFEDLPPLIERIIAARLGKREPAVIGPDGFTRLSTPPAKEAGDA